jgi:hypothetical protein
MAWRLALTCCVVACSSDAVCVITCPSPEAAEISVTASNAPTGIVGLTMTIAGPVSALGNTACSHGSGAVDVCTIYEEPGDFRVTLSAPGYQPNVLSFTATSKNVACCANLPVAQTLSVVMQPTSE